MPNRLAFAVLGMACVTAAGVGSYVATRQGAVGIAANTTSPTAAPALAQPVLEAETIQDVQSAQPVASAAQAPTRLPSRAPEHRPQRPARAAGVAAQPEGTVARSAGQRPELDGTSPGVSPSSPGPSTVPASPPDGSPAALQIEEPIPDVARASEPPPRAFQELVVSADSVIGLRTEGLLSSERARVEDRIEARVVRDVRVNGDVAIPAGTRVLGSVVVVERGGRMRARARVGIRFQALQLPDGTRVPISTETIYRLGDSPSNASAAKIGGGAVAGAILGAIIGGGKGAAIGATTGASAGTAAVMSGEPNAAIFPPGSEVTARILSPVTVTVERE